MGGQWDLTDVDVAGLDGSRNHQRPGENTIFRSLETSRCAILQAEGLRFDLCVLLKIPELRVRAGP